MYIFVMFSSINFLRLRPTLIAFCRQTLYIALSHSIRFHQFYTIVINSQVDPLPFYSPFDFDVFLFMFVLYHRLSGWLSQVFIFSGTPSLGDTTRAQKTDFDRGKIYFWVKGRVAQ